MPAYATAVEAAAYFVDRLYTDPWDNASATDRDKALAMATRAIDRLNLAGMKHASWEVAQTTQTESLILEAGLAQALQFPRGSDTEVPNDIKIACFEEALTLLDGKDPEREFEDLGIISEGYSSVRTTYDRSLLAAHIKAGIMSATAWKYLMPYLRDVFGVKLSRVS